jgi:diguanylate cyclase (GGDEF)-like protein/PAS domain S-box-containing protein
MIHVDSMFVLVGAAAAGAATLASARAGTRRRGRERGAWLLLSGCGLAWVAACGLRLPGGGAARDASIAVLLAATVLALLALRRAPGAPPHISGQARTLVDGLIVAASGLLVAWTAGLGDLYHRSGSELPAALGLAQACAALVVASAVVVVLTRSPAPARARLALWVAAFGFLAAAEGARAYAGAGGAADVRPLFAGWALGWAVLAWAATPAARLDDRPAPAAGLPTRASVLVPSLPFALAVVAAAAAGVRGDFGGFLIWNGAAVVVLIVARQILALLENISFWRDLEAQVDARTEELERSEARFRSLVQRSSDVITVIGPDGAILYESPSTRTVFGGTAAERSVDDPSGLIHPDDLPRVLAAVADLRRRPGATASIEGRVRHLDGTWCDVEAIASNLVEEESVGGFVFNTRDITERKALEAQLSHRAFHDPLTGLANRALFLDRLQHALGRSVRHRHAIGVLFLDLDSFKDVNDSMGHGVGDDLLVAVARRLDGCTRPADTVARLGGDEFAILVEELDDVLDVGHVAERILTALEPPLRIGSRQVYVRGSIGIATGGSAETTAEDLLRNADVAMYTAKARGDGGYELFEPEMRAALIERLELEHDLRGALSRREFELEYQPIVSLESGRAEGVEALVRWRHPRRGLMSPERFVHVAEQAGLIEQIGRWVLARACQQVYDWHQALPHTRGLTLSVNLSARQLQVPRLIDDVTFALERSGLAPASLVLEITESLVVGDHRTTSARLQQLRDFGVRVAIDDFGTGYSALGYLRNLPVDLLKIDRVFVAGLAPGSPDAALVAAVVTMCHSLDLTPVAEGVENAGQVDALRRIGCRLAQGYHFARPAPPGAIGELLASSPLAPLAPAVSR